MKIVCDACQAKYSISDDKVQGKVFKIRCKKCSNIIVVRGGAGAAEPAPAPAQEKETRVYDYGYDGGGAGGGGGGGGDEAVWHVVINQDQVGPMTAAEVQQRYSGGEIDAETYIWREGFADWMPIAQVDQFAGFVASGSRTGLGGTGGGAAAVSAMFGGGGDDNAGTMRSDPGDLFAAASSSARMSEDDGGDLFGSKPAAAQAQQSKLRGERNENSVLFSLNNLAQLASDKPAMSAPSSSSSPAGHATGAAGGEGSGLIDIRSMANAYLGGSAGAAKPATAGIGSIDDLPVFGGGGFSEPAVIVPTRAASANSKLMYALIGSVALLAVAAVILVVVLMKDDKKPAQVAGVTPTPTDKDKPSGETPKPSEGSATEGSASPTGERTPAGMSGSGSAEAPTTPTETKPPDTGTTTEKPKPPTVRREPRPTGTVVARTEPKPPREPKPAPVESSSGGCDEVSCVLNSYEGACCAKYKKGGSTKPSGGTAAPKSGGGDLPESLDRSMITEGVAKVRARVTSCGDRSSAKGEVKVSVKVSPDGSIASVTVKTTPDQALGNCVATAMQKATFKRTQSGGSFAYPWKF